MPVNSVDSVDRAITILQAFQEDGSLSLAELAQRTGFHKSTILRLIGSLEKFQLLSRSRVGGYRLGPELRRLGQLSARHFDLESAIRAVLTELVEATTETASFYVRRGKERLCLYRLNSSHAIRHHLTEGVCLPLERGAAGRVILAYTGGTDSVSIATRKKGSYVSYGERDPDIAAAAVPLFDDAGTFLGALAVSGLARRFDKKAVRRIVAELQGAATQLSPNIPHDAGHQRS